MKEESFSIYPPTAQPSEADQEVSFIGRNILMETSQPDGHSRGGQIKARASKGLIRGKQTREDSGDVVSGGEDVAQQPSRFEVDKHPTKIQSESWS